MIQLVKCHDCGNIAEPKLRVVALGNKAVSRRICRECDSVWVTSPATVIDRVQRFSATKGN